MIRAPLTVVLPILMGVLGSPSERAAIYRR